MRMFRGKIKLTWCRLWLAAVITNALRLNRAQLYSRFINWVCKGERNVGTYGWLRLGLGRHGVGYAVVLGAADCRYCDVGEMLLWFRRLRQSRKGEIRARYAERAIRTGRDRA